MADNILGKRLKILRKESNLTQTEFGKPFNLAKSTVSQYESGKSRPDDELKKKIAEFYNVSLDWLMGRTNIRNSNNPKQIKNDSNTTDDVLQDINKIYEQLSPEEKKELARYAKYLKTRDLLEQGDKESSSTSEVI